MTPRAVIHPCREQEIVCAACHIKLFSLCYHPASMLEFLNENPLYLIPIIFCARIGDVSLGTVRTILVFRGRSVVAACIGFLEVIVWVSAVGWVLTNLSAWYLIVAYAGGFSAGNIIGIWLEEKLAIGLELVRAVSEDSDISLADQLRDKDYPVVELRGTGEKRSPVEIVLIVEKRRHIKQLLKDIEAIDPDAYCTISDIKKHTIMALAHMPHANSGITSAIKKK